MKKILSIIALGCSISVSAQTYTLEQLKDAALRNNITVRNAQRSVEAAQQQRKVPMSAAPGSGLMPTKEWHRPPLIPLKSCRQR